MKEDAYLDRIQIVLVDTQDGANIGSVCRAMKTMGLTNLAIVGDGVYDDNRVRTLALHAQDLWDNAVRYKTLEEALRDSVWSVAATRRRGKFRKLSALSPEQLATKLSEIKEGRVSIVFGRESDGLRDDEVNLCSEIVTIPTSDRFPSLNLSQAVQIISYQIHERALPYKAGLVAVNKERIARAVDTISNTLTEIGYYKWGEEERWTRQLLSDIIERATLSESELQRFEKIFKKRETIQKFKGEEKKL